jgi:serine/threonine-protein kinase HipA
MRALKIYYKGIFAGVLIEENRNQYTFKYNEDYFKDASKPPISLTLPKTQIAYKSDFLFPCFFNILSEGVNKKLQSIQWHIDEEDSFGLLMTTAQYDTIGAITVKSMTTE